MWRQLYANDEERFQMTVPTRLGNQFSKVFEELLAERLG
jgi:hypothetical protein